VLSSRLFIRSRDGQSMSADEYRSNFAHAFEAYALEGARMRDLLLSLDDARQTRDSQAINDQQARLNDARRRYEEARCRYVDYVLKGFVIPDETT
jgi:hypothetical protein